MRARSLFIFLVILLSAGCGNRSRSDKTVGQTVTFPQVKVPSIYTDQEQILDFVAAHYWDGFWKLEGVSDTTMTKGLSNGDLEQAMANYFGILEASDIVKARKNMASLYARVESCAAAGDTACFATFARMVEKYLYDPNSPARNEDLYLPYVSGLAVSQWVSPEMKSSYEHAARMCAMNCIGEMVPDFTIRDIRSRDKDFHSIKADYIMLFFSNPGCTACKGIIDQVGSRPYVDAFIDQGILAVVNVYIDEDLDAWRSYSVNYPENWVNGYDPLLIIRDDVLFDLRAIPSLYLLDADKKVIMKDAPVEKVLAYMDKIANNQ